MAPDASIPWAGPSGWAVAPPPTTDRIVLTGADRERFLSGFVTCELKGLAPGAGRYGFFTDRKGGVLADFAVLALADRYWLEVPPGRGPVVLDHLAKFVLADRVELAPLTSPEPLRLLGAGAAAVLAGLLGVELPAEPWGHTAASLPGVGEVVVSRHEHLGAPGWSLWVAGDAMPALRAQLGSLPGAGPIAAADLEVLRVEAGLPAWGRDYEPGALPQETGLEAAAVSYTKGCYLGQEVVARIHYRGGVQHLLVGLRFAGPEPPVGAVEGAELRAEGRAAGRLGTVVVSPRHGVVALAVVHKRVAEVGSRVTVGPEEAAGPTAEVTRLPFGESEV